MADPLPELWMRPYWGGHKLHQPVFNSRLGHYYARCNKTMELDDREARRGGPAETACASCLKWMKPKEPRDAR